MKSFLYVQCSGNFKLNPEAAWSGTFSLLVIIAQLAPMGLQPRLAAV